MPVLLISPFKDVNIFHFFGLEIKAVWDTVSFNKNNNFILYLEDFDPENGAHKWRLDVLKCILPVYTNAADIPNSITDRRPLAMYSWMVEPHQFVDYTESAHYSQLARHIKSKYDISHDTALGTHAVLVTRKKSRILYDTHTGKLLEDVFIPYCEKNNIPYKVVCFDDCPFDEQARVLSIAKVMISCHGAGNTNVFLLPSNGHLVEINFRKHWNCDPVCDDHFFGKIDYTHRCNGPLTFKPYFHKADYHNLAKLFGRKYTEVNMDSADTFIDRNPINIKNVFVNSNIVFNIVNKIMN